MISNLSLFGALAWAEDLPAGAAQAAPNSSFSLIFIAVLFVAMYFFMIRPQQKRQKEHQAMLSAIQKGDKIQTSGGLIGTVTGMDQDTLTVEIAPQVRVKVGRGFIARQVRPGTENAAAEKKN